MKVVATIEARMKSTRLPGKVLRPVVGKPMLELLVERLSRAQTVSQVVVATTVDSTDDPIVRLANKLGVGCYRGSENDVLDRVLRSALHYDANLIVETTGDNPLVDPEVIDRLVDIYRLNDFDYVSNVQKRTYPLGLNAHLFSTKTLAEVAELTQDPADREHVSLYIYEHPERYRLHVVESGLPARFAELRFTVDTSEDLDLISAIYQELYPHNQRFRLADVLELCDRKPELATLNRGIQQKAARP
jgi:spore coat polysaccharide biosynthesis protein SpsF